jgi:hypothetical protein
MDDCGERFEEMKLWGFLRVLTFSGGFGQFPAFPTMNGDNLGTKLLPLVVLFIFVLLIFKFG